MTANKRIFLNILATYGRSLLAMACGLFASRWVLHGIGVEGYGVFGVVGVIIGTSSTLNAIIAGSVGRYYAYALGAATVSKDKQKSLSDCRDWFNVAFLLHFVVAVALVIPTLLVGDWAIDHYFSIPEKFLATSHWILYFSIAGMSVGMMAAPFRAMYVAKQCIAELTVYEIFTPLLNLGFAYALLKYDGDRLFFLGWYALVVAALPNIIIVIRSLFVFPECCVSCRRMLNWAKIRNLSTFAGWQFLGLVGLTIKTQGVPSIVNRMLGVEFNTTISVSGTVNGHVGSLSASLNNAFSPAVTAAAGASARDEFSTLSNQTSKFGTILLAVFAIPFTVEIDYAIGLWLIETPPMLSPFCVLMLMMNVIERSATGAMIAINANGNVKIHECLCFLLHLFTLVLCYVFAGPCALGMLGVAWGLIVGTMLVAAMRMALWSLQLEFGIREWAVGFIVPFVVVSALSYSAGRALSVLFEPSFGRMIMTCGLSFSIFLGGTFFFILSGKERNMVRFGVHRALSRMKR